MKKKSIVTEILTVAFIGVIGGVILFLIDRIDFSAALDSIYGILGISVPILFVLVNVISLIISEMRFRKAIRFFVKILFDISRSMHTDTAYETKIEYTCNFTEDKHALRTQVQRAFFSLFRTSSQ